MRLFIAIELPKELDLEFSSLKDKLDTGYAKINATEDNHLTLKFLGDLEENKLDTLKNVLKKVDFASFKIKLSDVGVFPNQDYVRVVWVGIKPEEETKELKKKIDSVLVDFNFKDDFDFNPHITLARVKFVADKEKFKELLSSLKFEEVEFEVKEFKLVKSELTPKGPVYEDLEVYRLK